MSELNYFGLKTDKDLFQEIQSAISEFSDRPNDRLFFFLVLGLNHLREWIAGASFDQINKKKKQGLSLTEEEEFFVEIWDLPEFNIVNSLGNRGEHYLTKNDEQNTSIDQGAKTGLARCGDSLDQTYYLIDGRDLRDILYPVIKKYYEWFEKVNK